MKYELPEAKKGGIMSLFSDACRKIETSKNERMVLLNIQPLAMTVSLLDSAFDNFPIPLIMINKESEIVYINQGFIHFLNLELSKSDIIGKNIHQFINNSRLPIVMETKVPELHSVHTYQDGRTAIGSRIPIIENGEVLGCIGYILFENAQELQKLALKYKQLETELNKYKKVLENRFFAKYSFHDLIGKSEPMQKCKHKAMKLANTELPILVLGESGVGKELFAHAIHDASKRRYGPLIRVNCSAIPQELFEAEFFGYETGAFSGAKKGGKKGLFELADKGTLFLDEIADLPAYMQVKLLRVLQEKEFLKVGGENFYKCDVRIIAATNRNINDMVLSGQFREDLFYRLNALVLHVPPLKERKEDIPFLIKYFTDDFCKENFIPTKNFSESSLHLLLNYPWPGNIRELKNVIERLIILSAENVIEPEDIKLVISDKSLQSESVLDLSLKEFLKQKEQEYILEVLHECGNNKARAAQQLGIHRSVLYKKISK